MNGWIDDVIASRTNLLECSFKELKRTREYEFSQDVFFGQRASTNDLSSAWPLRPLFVYRLFRQTYRQATSLHATDSGKMLHNAHPSTVQFAATHLPASYIDKLRQPQPHGCSRQYDARNHSDVYIILYVQSLPPARIKRR